MRTVSVTDLRHRFPKVEAMLRDCGELFVTRRGRVFARLTPDCASEDASEPPISDRNREKSNSQR
jgi:antitoxin (DNA-binding transcriptional repressor) of toxin-antitoxin stability system